jgi:hypothetical protein
MSSATRNAGKPDSASHGKTTPPQPAALARLARECTLTEGPRPSLGPAKMHNGFPVISEAEFNAGYRTQSDDDAVAVFNFRGYVERKDGTLTYADVTALNGLRKGVHVGIDGTSSYRGGQNGVTGPESIGEYVVYVTVPPEAQKAEGVLCRGDSCESVAHFREHESRYMEESDISEEVERYQSQEGWIVIRLTIEPRMPGARDAISVLSVAISEYLRQGYPLDKLERFVRAAESHLRSRTAMPADGTLLEEGAEAAWQRFMDGFLRGDGL